MSKVNRRRSRKFVSARPCPVLPMLKKALLMSHIGPDCSSHLRSAEDPTGEAVVTQRRRPGRPRGSGVRARPAVSKQPKRGPGRPRLSNGPCAKGTRAGPSQCKKARRSFDGMGNDENGTCKGKGKACLPQSQGSSSVLFIHASAPIAFPNLRCPSLGRSVSLNPKTRRL